MGNLLERVAAVERIGGLKYEQSESAEQKPEPESESAEQKSESEPEPEPALIKNIAVRYARRCFFNQVKQTDLYGKNTAVFPLQATHRSVSTLQHMH